MVILKINAYEIDITAKVAIVKIFMIIATASLA